MSAKTDRVEKNMIFPYIDYTDELGNRYFVDALSNPWFNVFLTFRVFFPVEALQIDSDHIDTVKIKSNVKKKKTNNAVLGGLGIGAGQIGATILSRFYIMKASEYIPYYRASLVLMVLSYFCFLFFLKQKAVKREGLQGMKKVKVNMRMSIKGFLLNLVYLILILLIFNIMLPADSAISLREIFVTVVMGCLICSFLLLQWANVKFTHINVKRNG